MKIARIKFAPWDKAYDFSVENINLQAGDCVLVETEIGKEVGKVSSIYESEDNSDLKPVIRKAEYDDLSSACDPSKKDEAMQMCQDMVDRHKLKMKLVDVYVSSQGNRYNFAFISDGRVDFRNLVRDLASRLGANIRLTQIGSRDEAKITGDCGPCGRGLCCSVFLNDFISISSEMAETQQVVHRGSDRISGMCGRLMCCLSYEYEGYKELSSELPPINTRVNIDGSRGVVISQNILKQTVNVKLDPERENERSVIVEVDIMKRKREKEEAKKLSLFGNKSAKVNKEKKKFRGSRQKK